MGKSLAFVILLALCTPALAEKSPEPSPADARIRSVVYNPRDVVALQGAYGYAMSVRFADHERVHDVALGDSVAWQAQVTGDKRGILLKPVETNANTNLLVRTSERLYHFSLSGFEASGPNDARLTYAVHFHYPQDELRAAAAVDEERERVKRTEVTTAAGPESYNWRYSWGGSDRSKPLRVFDDGRFTYFQFEEGRPLPAIFAVDEEGNEALVNSHQRGNFTVVERRERQFSLRDGNAVTCIFDETAPVPENRSSSYRRRKPL